MPLVGDCILLKRWLLLQAVRVDQHSENLGEVMDGWNVVLHWLVLMSL